MDEHCINARANLCETIEWLWGFYDGNALNAKAGFENDITEAWRTLWANFDHYNKSVAALEKRLARAEALAALVPDTRMLRRLATAANMTRRGRGYIATQTAIDVGEDRALAARIEAIREAQ